MEYKHCGLFNLISRLAYIFYTNLFYYTSTVGRDWRIALDNKEILISLGRIEGQLRGIQKMVENHRDILDIGQQLKAAHSAMRRVEVLLLKEYLCECIRSAIGEGEEDEEVQKINLILEQIVK